MDLNNINISDLKEKFLLIADKKTLIKFGIGFGSIILFLIIYYAILNPIVKTKKVMLDDMNLKQSEISTFNNEIITFKARIKKIEPEFKMGLGSCLLILDITKPLTPAYLLKLK